MTEISVRDMLLHPQSADDSDINGVIEFAIKALEKQIPKKAIDDGTQFAICPECGASVNKDIEQVYNGETSYCVCCGQALDWNDTRGGAE